MMTKPTESKALVAIKCLAYNHEKFIRDALEGFVMQKTDFPFVAIVHDDASTDGTAAIIREYAERYPDIIKPIFETENQYSKHDGSLRAIMDAACTAVGAKYIAMCEGDDYWIDPLKLQKQVDYLESHPDSCACFGDVNYINECNGKEILKVVRTEGIFRNFEDMLVNKYYLSPPTWVWRKDFFPSGDKRNSRYVDGTYAMAMDFCAKSDFHFIDEVFAVYRGTETGVSHVRKIKSVHARQKGLWRTQRDYIKLYPGLVSEEVKNNVKHHIVILANLATVADDKELLEVCRRYAKIKRDFFVQIKLCLLNMMLVKKILKRRYCKKGMMG